MRVFAMACVVWIVATIVLALPAHAAVPAGALDPTWGRSGVTAMPRDVRAVSVVPMSDGRTNVVALDGRSRLLTGVLDVRGTAQEGFEVVDATRTWVSVAGAVGTDDASWLLARVSRSGLEADVVAKLQIDGTLDAAFGSGGVVTMTGGRVTAIDVAPGGVVLGMTSVGGDTLLRRLDPATGAVDQTFGAGGDAPLAVRGDVLDVDVDARGAQVAVVSRRWIIRLTSTGSPQPGFGTNGVVDFDAFEPEHGTDSEPRTSWATEHPVAAELVAGSRVLVVGEQVQHYWSWSGRHRPSDHVAFSSTLDAAGALGVVRVHEPPESLDRFDSHDIIFYWGRMLTASLNDIRPIRDGYLAIGSSDQSGGPTVPMFARFDVNGGPVASFGVDGTSIANRVAWSQPAPPSLGHSFRWGNSVRRVTLDGPTDAGNPTLLLPRTAHRDSWSGAGLEIAWTGRAELRWTVRDASGGVAVELGGLGFKRGVVPGSMRPVVPRARWGCAAIRAVDSVGRRSRWQERCIVRPDPDTELRLSRGWRTVSGLPFTNGRAFVTARNGAAISVKPEAFNGVANRAVVAWTCSTCGWLRSEYGRESLRRPGRPQRRILYLPNSNRYITGGGRIVIDGVLTLDEMHVVWPVG